MKYQAVISDLYGTLIHNWAPEREEMTISQKGSVLSVNPADLIKLWRATTGDRMTGIFNSSESCLQDICHRLGVSVSDDQIRLAVAIRIQQTTQELEPQNGAEEVLADLRSQGYRTGLISNISMSSVAFWKTSRLMPLIDVAVMSCHEGTKKPDPRIYRVACERLKVEPENCLYVADGWDNELAGATSIGMTPVLIQHPGAPVSTEGSLWLGPKIESLPEVFQLL
jgi:putative hydrolase of the HAD superfamily